jgi:hypothetical protein
MQMWKSILISAAMAFATVAAHAHAGHDDEQPVSRESALIRADYARDQLVASKKLPASWQGKPQTFSSSRPTPKGPVWVVTYENPEEKSKAKRTLYIFIDEMGYFINSNHTGKL